MSESIHQKYRKVTREDFLATHPSYWRVFGQSYIHVEWWQKPCVGIVREIDEDDRDRDGHFATLEEAQAYARTKEIAILDEAMTQLRKRLSRPALFFKGLFDKKVRLHTEALQAKLQAATQLRALFAAGQAEVEVLDVKSELSVAGRLEVGTTLWLVSVAFPFNRRGPELIEVTVAEVDEWTHYLNSDSESVYEGAQVNVDYTHEVAVPPRSGGWDGPEGRRENLKNFKLDAGPLPEELPWNISGERLFTSKKAARKVLLELADKCLAAANA